MTGAFRSVYLSVLGEMHNAAQKAALVPERVPTLPRFNAVVVDHHDGDNVYVNLDEGLFDQHVERQSLRIVGCAARELKDPGGAEALANLQAVFPVGTPLVVTAFKWDKYGGRMDAVVSYMVNGVPHDLATDLISTGWAVPWDGRGAQPKPAWPRVIV